MACRNTVNWLYKLDKDYTYQSDYQWDHDMEFVDANGKPRMRLSRDGQITVLKGYCWDGCTPKFCVMDILIGTPEGAVLEQTGKPKTWDASLVHDALCQFLPADLPLSQHEVDLIMLDLLKLREFSLSGVYYFFVRAFGWFSKPLTYRLRHNKGGTFVVLDDDNK
jgi:hypothetical protein